MDLGSLTEKDMAIKIWYVLFERTFRIRWKTILQFLQMFFNPRNILTQLTINYSELSGLLNWIIVDIHATYYL